MSGPAYKRGVRIALTISPQASRMVDQLLATGLYGFNRARVVQEMVYRQLRQECLNPDTFRPLQLPAGKRSKS